MEDILYNSNQLENTGDKVFKIHAFTGQYGGGTK